MNRKYGCIKDEEDIRDLSYSAFLGSINPPESCNNFDYMPPIYDQGEVGRCTGASTTAALTWRAKKSGYRPVTFSPDFAYYNGRALEGTTSTDSGAQIRDVIKGLVTKGVSTTDYWPDTEETVTLEPNADAYKDALQHKVLQYMSVSQDIEVMKHVLATEGPIVGGITVCKSFESPDIIKSGYVPVPSTGETILGRHAIVFVDYDENYVRFRNSWGITYGIQGYGYLPWEYVLDPYLAQDFWVILKISPYK